jgi:hypothetical protein
MKMMTTPMMTTTAPEASNECIETTDPARWRGLVVLGPLREGVDQRTRRDPARTRTGTALGFGMGSRSRRPVRPAFRRCASFLTRDFRIIDLTLSPIPSQARLNTQITELLRFHGPRRTP